MSGPSVGVVVLAYADEPYLADCVRSVLASRDVDVRLVLVDNACTPGDLQAALDAARDDPRLTVLRPGRNTGFAGGCNLGAAQLDTEFVALVNSDCVLEPDALALLAAEASRPGVGPVMASVRLAERPELINSAGNPVHLVGLSWAGEMNRPETRTEPFDVTGASGACVLMAASVWKALDGFDEEYFAYLEDTELSLRCWRTGLAVRCVPTAIARHHYEFSRNANKMYLLERNRLMLLATVWPARALVLLAPLLVTIEVLLTVYAVASGWGGGKVRGWVWLWRNRAHIAARRRVVQAERTVPDREWMARLTPDLDPQAIGPAPLTAVANVGFRAYWALVRRLL
ncbi:Glycosyltransferase, GT2 family [Pseudonocardia thermophila]|uniref:Glycosyltransferase, GT2 family n=1 Tax=Pseudonocardia thermophila TaxID=1848 RepID=A0A1M6SPE6_PSETH|nr:glycosyltransferase family 2 protein [Pseudonocardia thermophila]SHK46592.1 Glycosyltransferase, GT2 family [Pseudonocardia thermophila]